MNLLAQKIWSNDLFIFVTMQMVEIKNRLRVTLQLQRKEKLV